MEGKSLVPALDNRPIQRDALYWEHEGNAAIRVGDWKLVRLGRGGPWELYDLKTDRTELHDLAAAEPELVRTLAAKWDAWAERTHVKPYPDEGAKKGKGKAKSKKRHEPDIGRDAVCSSRQFVHPVAYTGSGVNGHSS